MSCHRPLLCDVLADRQRPVISCRRTDRNGESLSSATQPFGRRVQEQGREPVRVTPTRQYGRVPDLSAVVTRLCDRDRQRTEADVQADVRQFLLTAPFELERDEVVDLVPALEAQVGDRRRIDVEIGLTVIEVKKDLRTGSVLDEAIEQLAGYVSTRTETLQQRYVGVLTDGADWYLYNLAPGGELVEVAHIEVRDASDTTALVSWLEGVLATTSDIVPTATEILGRLGADSSAHRLERATLQALYDSGRDDPSVQLKRELWARLLTTALGTQFEDSDDLFVEHTLLVASAEVIAHAVVGFDLGTVNPAALVSGALFADAQITGVVEADFFDWVIEVPGGDRFVRTLARRLARFRWHDVDHDVMKVLYESIIDADQRKKLGEYYTPDWLAERIVDEVVTSPEGDRILDPACGSGTFLFHAVRRVLEAHASLSEPDQLRRVTEQVYGLDLHPVAVTLARVTYLLAIGRDRLQRADRPPLSIPVYVGDSLQWNQSVDLLSSDSLIIPTKDGRQLFDDELRFPNELVQDSARFDQVVSELAERSASRTTAAVPSLSAIFRRFAIREEHQAELTTTFEIMCRLHDEGRDHIWGYYVRNLARPVWLSSAGHRLDVLIGNPPWLAYRFMPPQMQEAFRSMSDERGLWHGATVATHQDLSGLFLARAAQMYLKKGGRFGLVMPHAALSRRQFKGLRTARYPSPSEPTTIRFREPWDLHDVKPAFFPVPCSVLLGERTDDAAGPLPATQKKWSGRIKVGQTRWAEIEPAISYGAGETVGSSDEYASPYRRRFAQGATVVPRMLLTVTETEAGPLGTGAGRRPVRSRRSANEKRPWKDVPSLEGNIESQFVRPLFLGENVMSYRTLDPWLTVVPWDGRRLLDGRSEQLDLFPGLASWWREAEAHWLENRSSDRMALVDRLNYRRGLTDQYPISEHRVVYTKSGMYLAAARIEDTAALIDHKLYWAAAESADEALYLCAVLNSPELTEAVRPLQARGEHNPRDFDKYIWQLPIREFDPDDSDHLELAALAAEAESMVGGIQLDLTKRFQSSRKRIRDHLEATDTGRQIDGLVRQILAR